MMLGTEATPTLDNEILLLKARVKALEDAAAASEAKTKQLESAACVSQSKAEKLEATVASLAEQLQQMRATNEASSSSSHAITLPQAGPTKIALDKIKFYFAEHAKEANDKVTPKEPTQTEQELKKAIQEIRALYPNDLTLLLIHLITSITPDYFPALFDLDEKTNQGADSLRTTLNNDFDKIYAETSIHHETTPYQHTLKFILFVLRLTTNDVVLTDMDATQFFRHVKEVTSLPAEFTVYTYPIYKESQKICLDLCKNRPQLIDFQSADAVNILAGYIANTKEPDAYLTFLSETKRNRILDRLFSIYNLLGASIIFNRIKASSTWGSDNKRLPVIHEYIKRFLPLLLRVYSSCTSFTLSELTRLWPTLLTEQTNALDCLKILIADFLNSTLPAIAALDFRANTDACFRRSSQAITHGAKVMSVNMMDYDFPGVCLFWQSIAERITCPTLKSRLIIQWCNYLCSDKSFLLLQFLEDRNQLAQSFLKMLETLPASRRLTCLALVCERYRYDTTFSKLIKSHPELSNSPELKPLLNSFLPFHITKENEDKPLELCKKALQALGGRDSECSEFREINKLLNNADEVNLETLLTELKRVAKQIINYSKIHLLTTPSPDGARAAFLLYAMVKVSMAQGITYPVFEGVGIPGTMITIRDATSIEASPAAAAEDSSSSSCTDRVVTGAAVVAEPSNAVLTGTAATRYPMQAGAVPTPSHARTYSLDGDDGL
jgi:hypothetical protein